MNNHPGQALDHLDVRFPLAQEPGLIVMLKLNLNPPKAIYDVVTIGVYSRRLKKYSAVSKSVSMMAGYPQSLLILEHTCIK